MTIELRARGVRLVLLDIEGTTTPIAFVHDVLFPFARARLGSWLAAHAGSEQARDVIARLAREHQADREQAQSLPAWRDGATSDEHASAVAYGEWLMDRDRKSPALKMWQGLIWEDGYQAGELRGDVYPDVPPALHRWRASDVAIAIYSSGSELAQRRLFASTPDGDLTSLIRGYFDTRMGPKTDAGSYTRIAAALALEPSSMLFVSDVTRELVAAEEAGCQVVLSVRPGNPPQPDRGRYQVIASFDAIA